MRRIPYIKIINKQVEYICPRCKQIIPRDLYMLQENCPNCNLAINKVAKTIMKVYKILDREFYEHFIYK